MDKLLDAVEASCSEHVAAFTNCVEKLGNEGCQEQRAALQQCSEQSVQHIRAIQRVCKHPLSTFQNCVAEHPDDAHIQCGQQVNVFLTCAEGVMRMHREALYEKEYDHVQIFACIKLLGYPKAERTGANERDNCSNGQTDGYLIFLI
eukprot:gene5413-7147_t